MRSILLKLKSPDNFSAIIFIFLLVLVFIHLAGVGKKKETMAQEILGRLRALSSVQQRRAAAILGAVVADAATAPLHWIYDQGKVQDLTKGHTTEFYPTSQCPFYTIETGRTSTYGDQLHVTLKSLAERKEFSGEDMADQLYKHFGPGTEYEKARSQSGKPVKGPWTNHNLKIFIAKRENGESPATDTSGADPDGLVKSIGVIAMLSGKSGLLDTVEKCVKVTQSSPTAVGYALGGARILNHIIETGKDGLDAAIQQLREPNRQHKFETDETVAASIEKGKAASGKSHSVAVKEFGLACGMPASFHGMIHGIATAKDYQSAVRAGILAAGDNCSRGGFIGACVAARFGLESIPEDWVMKVKQAEEILQYIETIVQC